MDDKVISISLKVAEWNVVMGALSGRPYAEVAQLIADVQRQASEQLNPSASTPPEDAPHYAT